MSQAVPSDNDALLVFGNDHAPVFITNAVAIGLTVAQANAFDTANKDMQAAWIAYNKAKQGLKDAANAWKDARGDFRTLAVADCGLIKNFAERQPNPAHIYALAQIPAPSPRTPSVPPATATDLRATLDTETGELTVRWSATQPKSVSGVVYQVQRVLGSAGTFATVGLTGTKSFIDASIPAGTARIQYRVIGQRGGLVSPASAVLDVRLSTNAAGEVSIASIKMAA
ncbi:MAG TPA: hypothetical protein VEB22_14930 [Phycisphaerales bacterium]|nr:hypothetical protein [Phycisphaerales bacterium]